MLKDRRALSKVFQFPKSKQLPTQIDLFSKLAFKIDEEIKYFHEKHQLKRYMGTNPILKKKLKNILNRNNELKKRKIMKLTQLKTLSKANDTNNKKENSKGLTIDEEGNNSGK